MKNRHLFFLLLGMAVVFLILFKTCYHGDDEAEIPHSKEIKQKADTVYKADTTRINYWKDSATTATKTLNERDARYRELLAKFTYLKNNPQVIKEEVPLIDTVLVEVEKENTGYEDNKVLYEAAQSALYACDSTLQSAYIVINAKDSVINSQDTALTHCRAYSKELHDYSVKLEGKVNRLKKGKKRAFTAGVIVGAGAVIAIKKL